MPGWAPRAWGRYYKGVAPHIFGMFAECETDRCIDNLMGYYMMSKIGWNPDIDVDMVMDEFFLRMFGAAAAEMKAALDAAEDKFMNKVVGRLRMTGTGPVAERPGDYWLWTDMYSERETARLAGLYDAAERKVAKGSLEARRIALFRRWMLEPVVRRGGEYRREIDPKAGAARFRAMEKENLLGDDWWVSTNGGASRDKACPEARREVQAFVVREGRPRATADRRRRGGKHKPFRRGREMEEELDRSWKACIPFGQCRLDTSDDRVRRPEGRPGRRQMLRDAVREVLRGRGVVRRPAARQFSLRTRRAAVPARGDSAAWQGRQPVQGIENGELRKFWGAVKIHAASISGGNVV